MLHGIGPHKARDLINKIGSVELLFTESPSRLSKLSGIKPSFFSAMKREDALKKAVEAVDFHISKNVESIFYTSSNFPRRLSNCSDAPTMIYAKRNIDLNKSKYVSVVGTRQATQYGKEICRRLIESFVVKDIVIISGLAYGIDSYVHRYCVEFSVPTIAVLGHGLDRIYPSENRSLAKKMIENGGLITEFIPGTPPDRENFPKRNRIVAGMSDATIVVESKVSGGSLITAYLANSYDRDVFAFPGNINIETSQGCNALISQEKAHLIQGPAEFLKLMNWDVDIQSNNAQRTCFPELSATQDKIVRLIGEKQTIHVDIISTRLRIPISKLNVELFNLQLSGIISELPGKRYSIV
ncbi:MAG: DNA-protecting protein DprA [Crocinitomicaceae bacterium]|nr:DNA-protecting protein DprA [Crocinitomicaceae bacterium]